MARQSLERDRRRRSGGIFRCPLSRTLPPSGYHCKLRARDRAAKIPTSHNHPGFAGISGEMLLGLMRKQTVDYGVELLSAQLFLFRRQALHFFWPL